MIRSSAGRILTTHVGSLPGRVDIADGRLDDAVRDVVRRQIETGISVINEGEYTKGGDWLSYIERRLGGFTPRPPAGPPVFTQGRDREEFADFYRVATAHGTLFAAQGQVAQRGRQNYVCTGPISYTGLEELQAELAIFRAAFDASGAAEGFVTSTAPASLEPYRGNEFYASEDEFLEALAEAMRVEYEAIVAAGFLVQIDDAWLVALWDRIGIAMGIDRFRARCLKRTEVLNHALRNIPEDRIRYHLCWGSWHGPHAHDLPLAEIVDVLLRVRAQAWLIEAANPRHEHEHALWQDVTLPPGKILVPGVVSHCTDVIEHPELVAQRILRYADAVGAENVMAGTDCGFGERTHQQIAWAKLRALLEGAAIASRRLGG